MEIKRVIEIDEDTFKRIDEAKSVPDMFGTDIVNGLNAIKYGKPYDDSGDLISRKVIKRLIGDKSIPIKFEEGTRGNWQNSSGLLLSDIYKVIDNAPTVEAYTLEDMQNNYDAGVDSVIGKYDKAKGEWYYGEDECRQDGWFCSECSFFVPWYYQYYEKDIDFIRDYKACPHCLAEMVTYTGKDRDTEGGAE